MLRENKTFVQYLDSKICVLRNLKTNYELKLGLDHIRILRRYKEDITDLMENGDEDGEEIAFKIKDGLHIACSEPYRYVYIHKWERKPPFGFYSPTYNGVKMSKQDWKIFWHTIKENEERFPELKEQEGLGIIPFLEKLRL